MALHRSMITNAHITVNLTNELFVDVRIAAAFAIAPDPVCMPHIS